MSTSNAGIMFLLLVSSSGLWAAGADGPPEVVPLGVYLSWERTAAGAAFFKTDRWTDVCKRLDVIAANNVDALWVTNMSEGDLPRLIEECGKRGVSLLVSMGAVEGRVKWRWKDGGKYYDSVVPNVVKLAGESKTLIGWS